LDRLRVLAITTPTPEIQSPAGGIVNVDITPYISDIGGSGNLTLNILSCLDPGTILGVPPSCEGQPFVSALQTLSVSAPAGQADGVFGSPERTGAPSTGAITVGLNVPAGLLSTYSLSAQNNGVPYLITVEVSDGTNSIRAFRRILFSSKTANTNPTLSDLLGQGVSMTNLPSTDTELSFTASGAPESYTLLGVDGVARPQTEIFETTWFISDGEILNPRSKVGEITKWTVPGAPPQNRQAVLAGVLRDGRGGVSVLIRKLN
jgi:hypothetical protein